MMHTLYVQDICPSTNIFTTPENISYENKLFLFLNLSLKFPFDSLVAFNRLITMVYDSSFDNSGMTKYMCENNICEINFCSQLAGPGRGDRLHVARHE